jgi:hypothetical protein
MDQDFFAGAEQSVPVDNPSAQAQGGVENSRKHPIAVFFHLVFKIAAIVVYIVMPLITGSFILAFIIVIILLAADFWTTKNVTGRLLVGLRWWHYVKEDGTNVWMFESSKNPSNAVEAVIFCTLSPPPQISAPQLKPFLLNCVGTSLVGTVPVWVLLAIVALLGINLKWLFLIAIAVVLSLANVVGYGKCMKDKKGKIKSIATSMAADYVVNNTFN